MLPDAMSLPSGLNTASFSPRPVAVNGAEILSGRHFPNLDAGRSGGREPLAIGTEGNPVHPTLATRRKHKRARWRHSKPWPRHRPAAIHLLSGLKATSNVSSCLPESVTISLSLPALKITAALLLPDETICLPSGLKATVW